jgi:tetratricopeptide (TPR) repeat protein
MTSHIYVALGLWEDVVSANVTALRVESAKTDGEGSRSREAWHHRYWLHYGHLQLRHLDEAQRMLGVARERIASDPLPREPSYYGAMVARFLIDTESWDEANEWLAPDGVDMQIPHYYFARAFAAAKLGKLEKARDLMAQIRTGGSGNPEIMLEQKEVDILKLEVEAVIALAEGKGKKALELARRATEMLKSMPFRYGPPRISKPAAELLGDILSALGEYEQSALAYQDQLSRSQLRSNSLLGLARASALAGDEATSAEAYEALEDIWHKADANVQALTEVRDHTSRGRTP